MIEYRPCQAMEELDACVALEIETWGYDMTELVARRTFLLAQKIGGQVIGAFETGSERTGEEPDGRSVLVGFVISLPGIKQVEGEARPYLHSHMLAVQEAYRNRGIGAELKREQRREALARGIRYMEWTFDPLQIKNAFLNIHRLGAIVRSYRPDFYGVSSSRLQGGLPTDRLVAEWRLDSPWVQAHLDGCAAVGIAIEERIQVPASIEQWKASHQDRDRARAVQVENCCKFQHAFNRGLAVLGFSRDTDGNGIYELGVFPGTEQFPT